jgi:hypothetical protein
MDLSYSVVSVNGIPIRLLAERWSFLNACCDDVLATVGRPDFVLRGGLNTQVAVRRMAGGRYLTVTYRELSSGEGFVVSAVVASSIEERAVVWRARSRR